MEDGKTISIAEADLKSFCRAMFERVGVPADESYKIVESLVEADLRGVASHGVVRLPIYVQRIVDGGSNSKPEPWIVRQTRTTAVLDGDNGMGQIVGIRAMEIALEKASDGDCAFVSVRNSNHFGAASHFAEMAAARDMIGLCFTIGGINHMTPWGGADAILGNNPFSFAFPTRDGFPVVLDMACSIAARGKIIVAAKDGTPIPADWASGPDGLPTTDPVEALKGFVLPVGGPKGYALTLGIGLLSTMLSGAFFGSEVTHMYDQTSKPQNVGHLFGVLPIAAFEDLDRYYERMTKALRDIRETKRAPGVERLYLPGEREHLAMVEHRRNGIPLNAAVFEELCELGHVHGLELRHWAA